MSNNPERQTCGHLPADKALRAAVLIFALGALLLFAGCSSGKEELVEEADTVDTASPDAEAEETEETEDTVYLVYCLNESSTGCVTFEYEPEGRTEDELLDELFDQLEAVPADTMYSPALGSEAVVLEYSLDDGRLVLDFESTYQDMSRAEEILVRSAVVRTLCQIPGVDSVSFTVEGETLLDSKSTPVGDMTAESFVENTGDDINVYTTTTLDLYFANETGDMLKEELVELRYSSNMSIEKLVLEQLIRGPISDDAYPTIPSATNILSVSTKDGICYVNLDEGFLDYGYDLIEELPIYSIVNSLTEISGINQVQILINGETDLIFQESISFDTIFERNLDLVESSDE